MKNNIEKVIKTYRNRYKSFPKIFKAPGRINLLGEHTDYNEGFVLPAAINFDIAIAIGQRKDNKIELEALDLNERFTGNIKNLEKTNLQWPNYILGVIAQFQQRGHTLSGFQLMMSGDIPLGAGLSSSAALVSGVAFAINSLWELGYCRKTLAKIAQAAENQFVGVNCGIMDQFASLHGIEGHGFKLDCRTLEHHYFPMHMGDYRISLINSNVKHNLSESAYNQRRLECAQGLKQLNKTYPKVSALRDANMKQLREIKHTISNTVFNRCRYVIEENCRTEAFAENMKNQNWIAAGSLMFKTHQGLRDLYEVSCPEMDFLVKSAMENHHIVGARMMGGGFGGCMLVMADAIEWNEDWFDKLSINYEKNFNKTIDLYDIQITGGVHEMKIEYTRTNGAC